MKKLLMLLVIFIFTLTSTLSFATMQEDKDAAMLGDTLVMRPLGIIATVLGAAFFVVSLPFSVTGKNVPEAGRTMVANPAKFTFARPLGDFGPEGEGY